MTGEIISFKKVWQATIGIEISETEWKKSNQQNDLIKVQSEQIARRLEGQGVDIRGKVKTSIIGLCSGITEKAISYRNTNIIPVNQSKNVHKMLSDLKYFYEQEAKNTLRMFVISAGWVFLEDYKDAHRAHTRRMSKFAAEERLKENAVELVFYNVENTIKTVNGRVMLNMHSHALVKSNKKLGSKKWLSFINWAKTRFPKGYFHDSKLKNVNECVKYCFKPMELEKITDQELAELFHQTFLCRFFIPLGSFRKLRKSLKDNRLNIVKIPTEDSPQSEKALWEYKFQEKQAYKLRKLTSGNDVKVKNRILTITNPSPKFTNKFEPCLVVQNYDGDLDKLIKLNCLEKTIAEAKKIYNRPPASMQHTTTITVQKNKKQSVCNQGRTSEKVEYPFLYLSDKQKEMNWNKKHEMRERDL